MELFLLTVTFLIYVCQHGPNDAIHAVKGTTPPRYQTKAAAAARRGTTWTAPKYGTKDWFGDLWSDSLATNTDWRRRRAARKARERQLAKQQTPEPTPAPVPAPGPTCAPEPEIDPPLADEEVGEQIDPELEIRVQEINDDRPDAKIIPLFRKFEKKENDMSIDVNAEVQGLVQAIAHATLMVQAGEELGTPGGEQFLAHLTEADNGEQTIAAASAAQQAFDNAAAEAKALLDMLTAQLAVKEASDAINGEHGSKAFMGQGE